MESRVKPKQKILLRLQRSNFLRQKGLGFIRDLALRGMRFETNMTGLKKKEKLLLTLRLPAGFPGSKTVALAGRILWVKKTTLNRKYRVACVLTYPAAKNYETVRQLIWSLTLDES